MTSQPTGIACLRNEVLYVESSRIHLADLSEHELKPLDRFLIDMIQAGHGDFGKLLQAIRSVRGGDSDPTRELVASVSDARSVIELVPHFVQDRPDVIVCSFEDGGAKHWSKRLVARLRKRSRVLFLGHESILRGPVHQNVTFEASEAAGQHANWYQFIQWVRGTLMRFEGATLVLCGQIDSILFGDLAPFFRTVTIVPAEWPARVGLADSVGRDWVPEDLLTERRELYYALRFGGSECLAKLKRETTRSFATLEAHAIRYSTLAIPSATDHRPELESLGVPGDSIVFANGQEAEPTKVKRTGEAPDVLVIVCGRDGGPRLALPFVQLLGKIPAERRPYTTLALRVGPMWFAGHTDQESARLAPWEGPAPTASRVLASIVLVGLCRHLLPVWNSLALSAPCWLVPSRHAHPIQVEAPEELILRNSGPDMISERLRAVSDPAGRDRAEFIRVQHAFLDRLRLSRRILDLVKQPALSEPESIVEEQLRPRTS